METQKKSGIPHLLTVLVTTTLAGLLNSGHIPINENKKESETKTILDIPSIKKVKAANLSEIVDPHSIYNPEYRDLNYAVVAEGKSEVTGYFIPVYPALYFTEKESKELTKDLISIFVKSNKGVVKIYITKDVAHSIYNESLARLQVVVDGIPYNIWVNQQLQVTNNSDAYLGPTGIRLQQYVSNEKLFSVAASGEYDIGDIVIFKNGAIAVVCDRGSAVTSVKHFDVYTGDKLNANIVSELNGMPFTVYRKKSDTLYLEPGDSLDSVKTDLAKNLIIKNDSLPPTVVDTFVTKQ